MNLVPLTEKPLVSQARGQSFFPPFLDAVEAAARHSPSTKYSSVEVKEEIKLYFTPNRKRAKDAQARKYIERP